MFSYIGMGVCKDILGRNIARTYLKEWRVEVKRIRIIWGNKMYEKSLLTFLLFW